MKKLLLMLLLASTTALGQHTIRTNTFYDDVIEMSTTLADEVSDTSLTVTIIYMARETTINGYEVYAYMRPDFVPHKYYIYLSVMLDDKDIPRILAHEFIHIRQHETGELKIIDYQKNLVRYRGRTFVLRYYGGFRMPHEADAYRQEGELLKLLRQ